jgi:uncharacterized protein with HEPN domain
MPRDEGYLLYMLLAARRVVRSTANITRADFDANDEKRDSVVLQLGNIGEAANKVSEGFRKKHPEIPWGRIIGMRYRLFHDYQRVNWNTVWDVATNDVPRLTGLLEPLIPPEDSV